MFSKTKSIEIIFSTNNLPKLRSPYLICGFPGTGFVGKLSVDYLIKELDAKPLADIFSSFFSPQIMIKPDGTAGIVKNSLYYVTCDTNNNKQIPTLNKSSKTISKQKSLTSSADPSSSTTANDLILLTGDSQPIVPGSEYLITEKILDIAMEFQISSIYSLAAYVTGALITEPRIFGTATNQEIVKSFRSFNISSLDNGNITGMNGLILGMGKLRGIEGTCLLGETSGYVMDAKASKNILEILNNMLDIKINMDEINKRAKDTEILIKNLEQQMLSKSGQIPQNISQYEDQGEDQAFPQNRKSNMGYIS